MAKTVGTCGNCNSYVYPETRYEVQVNGQLPEIYCGKMCADLMVRCYLCSKPGFAEALVRSSSTGLHYCFKCSGIETKPWGCKCEKEKTGPDDSSSPF